MVLYRLTERAHLMRRQVSGPPDTHQSGSGVFRRKRVTGGAGAGLSNRCAPSANPPDTHHHDFGRCLKPEHARRENREQPDLLWVARSARHPDQLDS